MSFQGFQRIILIASALCGIANATTRAASGDIHILGTLGGTTSSGSDINAGGEVTGAAFTPTEIHAFRYTGTPGSGSMADLGTLGGPNSYGNAINAAGDVAGESYMPDNQTIHAFRYIGTPGSGGAMQDLGTLGGGFSTGRGINASGQVTGWSQTASNTMNHAFRYTGTPGGGGSMVDLGTLGGPFSYGFDINDSGQVAGWAWTTPDIFGDATGHAFRYTGAPGSGGVMHDLGTLGGTDSFAKSINASGQVAGHSNMEGDYLWHAFLYTGTPGRGGTMHDLGTLEIGGGNSVAWDINTAGQVVGTSTISGSTDQHAFLYTGTPGVGSQMIDLDNWLNAQNPIEGSKWTLFEARGLNDSGLITGEGYYDDGFGGLSDGPRGFILNASSLVPEPGGLAVVGLALPALLRRAR